MQNLGYLKFGGSLDKRLQYVIRREDFDTNTIADSRRTKKVE